MTKVRDPMSFEAALMKVATLIGYDGCASVLGVSDSAVRKMADPDIEREISIQKARRLDRAYVRAGGDCSPFRDCFHLQTEVEAREQEACPAQLLSSVGVIGKETGEAVSAIVQAINNLGCGRTTGTALREIEEAICSFKSAAGKIRGSRARKGRG